MQFLIDLFVNRDDVDTKTGLREIMASWGGESFSQDPARFEWRDSVVFTRRESPGHISRLVSRILPVRQMAFLSIDYAAIAEWERTVNSGDELDLPKVSLRNFLLEALENIDEWALAFDCDGDDVGWLVRMTPRELVQKIDEAMDRRREVRGFIAWNSARRGKSE